MNCVNLSVVFYEKTLGSTRFFVFSELEQIPGLLQAFTTRATDHLVRDAPIALEVAPGKSLFLSTLGIRPEQVVQLKQVHSDRVIKIDSSYDHGAKPQQADGIQLARAGFFAVIKTADCAPIIAVHPKSRSICALHAGWRGTRDRITRKALTRFLADTGASPEELLVAIGPSIRRCCYEVGEEVLEQFDQAGHDMSLIASGRQLDIVEANRAQVEELGIERFLDSGMCTACRTDLFYSYRREGKTGRLWALAGFRNW
ncbi:MAG: peptidoglycan editing factor PgeF [Acidobacteria bacterium]|nr:MAG: peptidoglycan editing factor PgeF [Acidobacteriota bacterium]